MDMRYSTMLPSALLFFVPAGPVPVERMVMRYSLALPPSPFLSFVLAGKRQQTILGSTDAGPEHYPHLCQ